jgi:hypothetical protein
MEAWFVAGADGDYLTRVTRDDKVTIEIRGSDRTGGLPHDLAHFVVESELALPYGFWGCVGRGAEFRSVRVLAGRRPPRAGERSTAILREAGQRLTEAEVLVGVLIAASSIDRRRYWPVVRERLDRGWTILTTVDEQAVERACRRLRSVAQRWAALPPGGELHLVWRVPSPRRPARSRSR